MTWMPGVDTSKRANDGNSQLVCNPDVVCLHTIVGYAPALAAHFSVRADGYIWQHRDTNRQSAANLNGNKHIIAIENEDHGPVFGNWNTNDGHAVPAFTPQQIESNAQICAWAYKTHGIPLEQTKDSKPGSKGIAYHRLGIKSNNNFAGYAYGGWQPGGELWSNATGKVCPGDRRISQTPQITSRARQIAGLEIAGGDDMKDLILAQESSGKVWVGNGILRRHVKDEAELDGLQYWIGQKGGDPEIKTPWTDLRVLGTDITDILPTLADDESKIIAEINKPVSVEIDYDQLIDGIVDKLGALRFDVD